MVVSQNALASEVGARILARGGNAVDAAIAVGFALAVTLPRAGNLGGSGFMLIYEHEKREVAALDYRSTAPCSFNLDHYLDASGKRDRDKMTFGASAPGVPGTVAGMYKAWQDFGSMPWEELLEPARDLAKDGIRITDDLAYVLGQAKDVFSKYEASAAAFLKEDGTLYKSGDLLRQPDLAWSIEQIMAGGADAFYSGAIADKFDQHILAAGGLLSRQDLMSYQVKERSPVMGLYRGHQIIAMAPVSGGGLTLIQMLNVLHQFPLSKFPPGGADSVHTIAETMKQAAANRRIGIGDPDFVDVPIKPYTGKEIARKMAKSIRRKRARPTRDIEPLDPKDYESRDTTHYSIVDKYGNAVSNTYTLGYSFGSGYVVPETGILLDNQMRNFSYDRPHANAPAPCKRMVSTMTPTMVFAPDGSLMLVTGTPGGGRIINILLQLIVNVIDYGMNIAEATLFPRIHQQWRTPQLGVEKGLSPDTLALLKKKGHVIEHQQTMGSTQSIRIRDGVPYGAADSRRPGAAAISAHLVESGHEPAKLREGRK